MPNTASKLRVLIATTNGPVEVLLLTEEDAAIGRRYGRMCYPG